MMKLVKKNFNGECCQILLFIFEEAKWAFLSPHISPVIQVASANKYEGFPPVNKN